MKKSATDTFSFSSTNRRFIADSVVFQIRKLYKVSQKMERTQSTNAFFQIFAPACRIKSVFICVYLRFRIARTPLLLKPRRAVKYIKMCINVLRFSPRRTQSMYAFYDIYLRWLVISHLRKSADRSKKSPALLSRHGFPAPSLHTPTCPPLRKSSGGAAHDITNISENHLDNF